MELPLHSSLLGTAKSPRKAKKKKKNPVFLPTIGWVAIFEQLVLSVNICYFSCTRQRADSWMKQVRHAGGVGTNVLNFWACLFCQWPIEWGAVSANHSAGHCRQTNTLWWHLMESGITKHQLFRAWSQGWARAWCLCTTPKSAKHPKVFRWIP